MKLKKVIFAEPFRKLGGLKIDIAPRITAIGGHNGIGKSTILGLIANCSGLSAGEKSLFGKAFQSNFQDAFHLDYQADFAKYVQTAGRSTSTPKVVFHYLRNDGSGVEKTCSVSTQKYAIKESLYKNHMVKVPLSESETEPNPQAELIEIEEDLAGVDEVVANNEPDEPRIEVFRLRLIPRTTHIFSTEDSDAQHDDKVNSKKVPIPTLYLGMSRMTPIGEFESSLIDRKTLARMDEEDKRFIFDSFYSVLPFKKEGDAVTSHSFAGSKKGSVLPSFQHHSFTVSLGQDSLSAIITALASFNRLKRTKPDEYQGGILVIDEVDAGLHPRAQEKLIELLHQQSRRLDLQIILTTHSLTVMKSILNKNDHPGSKVNDVVYLTDSNHPRIMEQPTYTKIKTDMLVLPPSEPKPDVIKLYFEDDEALFFFEKILAFKQINYQQDVFGKKIQLISVKVGCNILLSLHQGDEYFKSVVLIPDNDVYSEANKRRLIGDNPSICPLPGCVSFDENTPSTHRNPEAILYRFLQEKLTADNQADFWRNMPSSYTSDYVQDRVMTIEGQPDREKNKEWFNANRLFIEQSSIVEKWCRENETQIDDFISKLIQAVDMVSQSDSYQKNQAAH